MSENKAEVAAENSVEAEPIKVSAVASLLKPASSVERLVRKSTNPRGKNFIFVEIARILARKFRLSVRCVVVNVSPFRLCFETKPNQLGKYRSRP